MKDFGSDSTKAFWIIGLTILAFPIMMIIPLATPFLMAMPFFWFGFKQINLYKSSKSWPQVAGRLIETSIGTYEVAQSEYRRETFYFPLAYFSYSFDGSEYTSNQYCLDRKSIWNSNQTEVSDVISDLEAKESLKVYVNPLNPKAAVLNVFVSSSRVSHAYALVVSGLIISLVGVFMLVNYDKF